MTYLQLAAHLFLLLFWVRLWRKPAQEFYFNPFLSGPTRLTDNILRFLRPALRLPDRPALLLALAFFWIFQALFFARFGKPWHITFGLIRFAPPEETLAWGLQFAYSGLHAMQFLLHVWTLYFFTRLIAPPNRATRSHEAFAFFTNPFSRLPLALQPLVLLTLHFALAFAVTRTGALAHTGLTLQDTTTVASQMFTGAPTPEQLLRIGGLAAVSFTSGIETLIYTIIFFILGGLFLTLAGAQTPSLIFRESVDVLMGRFSRNPNAAGGGLDFTPMLFIIVLSIISGNLQLTLSRLLLMPLPS